jgi:hypothetical protein
MSHWGNRAGRCRTHKARRVRHCGVPAVIDLLTRGARNAIFLWANLPTVSKDSKMEKHGRVWPLAWVRSCLHDVGFPIGICSAPYMGFAGVLQGTIGGAATSDDTRVFRQLGALCGLAACGCRRSPDQGWEEATLSTADLIHGGATCQAALESTIKGYYLAGGGWCPRAMLDPPQRREL